MQPVFFFANFFSAKILANNKPRSCVDHRRIIAKKLANVSHYSEKNESYSLQMELA